MCMSSRHPPSTIAMPPRQASLRKQTVIVLAPSRCRSNLNFEYSVRLQGFQKLRRLDQIEFLVSRFYHQKKTVFRRQRKSRNIKNRMIRRRQPVHSEHAKNRAKRSSENGQLKRNRYPRGPAVVRLAANIQRETDYVRVVAHKKAAKAAQKPPGKDHRRQLSRSKSNCLGHSFHGHRRECVDALVTGVVSTVCRSEKLFGRLEFGQQSVDSFALHALLVNLRIRISHARQIRSARPGIQLRQQSVISRLRFQF